MSIRVIECEQGSPEWHDARAGVITASLFSETRKRVNGLTEQQQIYVEAILRGMDKSEAAEKAGYKRAPSGEKIERALDGETVGDFTREAIKYARRLAIERTSGKALDNGFETYAMRRGHELEPDARFRHEREKGLFVERAGFVVTPDGRFGASADGLIDDDGGSEYKCLIDPDRIFAIIQDGELEDFMDQIQGCLWLTGRKWWDFCLYCPDLAHVGKDLYVHRVERDDNYIEALERDLLTFDELVADAEAWLRKPWHGMKEAA